MEIKLQRGIMDERYREADRPDSGHGRQGDSLPPGISQGGIPPGMGGHYIRPGHVQRTKMQGLRKVNFEELADRIFDPTSSDLAEAAEVIRYCGRLERLHQRSLCTRCKRALSKPINWLAHRL